MLTAHLHAPVLRLVYLPQALIVSLVDVPGFLEGEFTRKFWIGAEMSAKEVMDAVIEELGIRLVILQGVKTARVEYVLQRRDSKQGRFSLTLWREPRAKGIRCLLLVLQLIPYSTKLLPHLQSSGSSPPFSVTFTVSSTWLARIGTVGNALTTSSSHAKPRIGTRDEGNQGSWRPSSIFAGIWAAPIVSNSIAEEGDGEEEEKEGTIKGLKSSDGGEVGISPRILPSNSLASGKARLSTLFTDWLTADDTSNGDPSNRSRVVSEPLSVVASSRQDPECELPEDLEASLDALMVSNFFLPEGD